MRSRVSSTSEPTPTWKTWVLHELARYWYGLGVLALLVFGVLEVARLSAPLDLLKVTGLLLLSAALVAGGLVGYVMLWRRETEEAQWILRALSKLASKMRSPPSAHREGASSQGDPEDLDPGRQA